MLDSSHELGPSAVAKVVHKAAKQRTEVKEIMFHVKTSEQVRRVHGGDLSQIGCSIADDCEKIC